MCVCARTHTNTHTHERETELARSLSLSRTIAPSLGISLAPLTISHMPRTQDARERTALEMQLQEARDGAEEREIEWSVQQRVGARERERERERVRGRGRGREEDTERASSAEPRGDIYR